MKFLLSLFVGTLLVVALISAIVPEDKGPRPAGKPADLDLILYAQLVVEKILKSPSSASFPSAGWNPEAYQVQNQGGGRYLITGYVDAENSFGATMRERWKVLLVPEMSGSRLKRCEVFYLQIGEQVAVDRRAESARGEVDQ